MRGIIFKKRRKEKRLSVWAREQDEKGTERKKNKREKKKKKKERRTKIVASDLDAANAGKDGVSLSDHIREDLDTVVTLEVVLVETLLAVISLGSEKKKRLKKKRERKKGKRCSRVAAELLENKLVITGSGALALAPTRGRGIDKGISKVHL